MDEIFKTILSMFDIRYMAGVFLTSEILLKYTKLKILKTTNKRLFVLLLGVIYAAILVKIDFDLYSIAKSAFQIFKEYGISLFSTVLFYDLIYKKVRSKFGA